MARFMPTMNTQASHGHKVRFSYPNNGYSHHQATAAAYLTFDDVYTVDVCNEDTWHTDVYLVEFPGVAFNSVMFTDVED